MICNGKNPLISIIIPIHNGGKWINECFESILKQDILEREKVEISVFDDSSTDDTFKLVTDWGEKISNILNLSLIFSSEKNEKPKGGILINGVGYAKNKAIEQSSGQFLCFQDVDDLMLQRRISAQLEEAKKYPEAIIGCQIKRIPEDSTRRFVDWANRLSQNLLTVQIYTSHGPTVLMPTWFFNRKVYEKAGKFSEEGKGTPEDLLFFYSHLDGGGIVRRVDEVLLIYRYHPDSMTFTVTEETMWNIRLARLEKSVLVNWDRFTIWNAGKQGRKLYRSLKPSSRKKVIQFCDVDSKKTGKFYEPYFKSGSGERVKIPIVHFTKVQPPLITCVKLDLTEGQFEKNLNSLNLTEGRDFVIFS